MDGQEKATEPEIDVARFRVDPDYRAFVERSEQNKLDDERLRFRLAVDVAVRVYSSDFKL